MRKIKNEGRLWRSSPGSELLKGLLSVLGLSGGRDAERPSSDDGRADGERRGSSGGADHGGAASGGAEQGGGLHDWKGRKNREREERALFLAKRRERSFGV